MVEIPKTLWTHINAAFPNDVCLVATTLPSGYAQITPRGTTLVFDDGHFSLWERGKGSTTANLVDGTKVTIYFRKPQLRADGILPKGGIARFYGSAGYADPDEQRFVDRFTRLCGADILNPPSLNARRARRVQNDGSCGHTESDHHRR
jgi:hypothetical protein